jgi:hypothetical protein
MNDSCITFIRIRAALKGRVVGESRWLEMEEKSAEDSWN